MSPRSTVFSPKRYQLSELVDWFFRVMRRDDRYGYKRYDLRFDPFFKLRVTLTNAISPYYPIANLHWERVEREYVTDKLEKGVRTLEDLGIQLTAMEDQVPWELKPFRYAQYYAYIEEQEPGNPDPPKTVA